MGDYIDEAVNLNLTPEFVHAILNEDGCDDNRCWQCSDALDRLCNLAANLATAAGIQFGWNLARDYDSVCAVEWYPGCGRPAPGWGE